MHFGEHFMLDGYDGNYSQLNDKELVLKCLNELPEELGMSKLSTPEVYFAQGNDKKDPGGWSGFVVIAESHISVHTFPARGFVSIDVYTCKNGLDTRYMEHFFKKAFDLKKTETNFIERGLHYPMDNIQ